MQQQWCFEDVQLTPELEHEIDCLLADYYEATAAKDGIPPYEFDWALYEHLQALDVLLVTTARSNSDNALLGFALYHVVPMPHHKGLLAAECDSISVAHTQRGQGIGKDRKSTRLNSSHSGESRMPSSA